MQNDSIFTAAMKSKILHNYPAKILDSFNNYCWLNVLLLAKSACLLILSLAPSLARYLKVSLLAGHVIPGLWFLGWGLYWAQASFRRQIRSQHSGRQYLSKPWYPMMLLGGWLYAAEPFLKSIAAPIGLSIELYFDSKDGFR